MRPADADELAGALCRLAGSPRLRDRLARQALVAVRERTWEAALRRLADGYEAALGNAPARAASRRAA